MLTWEQRYADLLERIMATAAANGDPRPLQEEFDRLMAERPASERKRDVKPRRAPEG